MPPHIVYCEPFFGGGAVLLAKNPEGVSEVVNDLNGDLSNFWRVLQDADTWRDFCRIVQAIPFSEVEFADAQRATVFGSDVDRAVNFFVSCRQSLAGRMASFAPLSRTRTRRGMNEQAAAWLTAVEGLPAVHERLKRVVVLNRDALEVIRSQDGPDVCFYLDPPYTADTRTAPDVYAHEMPREKHVELLKVLSEIDGKFLLSGYRSKLYDKAAEVCGWARRDFELPNNAAGGKDKRRMIESCWANYELPT